MVYFTSDLHFYHEKIVSSCKRKFRDAKSMNQALIHNWNKTVNAQDEVYILGDFTMKGPELAMEILQALKGKKHLVCGNHDDFVHRSTFDKSLFVSVGNYREIEACNTKFVLFHYPILEWNGQRHGSVQLHGHCHSSKSYNFEMRKQKILRFDVGVDANDMKPVSAQEILSFFYSPKQ